MTTILDDSCKGESIEPIKNLPVGYGHPHLRYGTTAEPRLGSPPIWMGGTWGKQFVAISHSKTKIRGPYLYRIIILALGKGGRSMRSIGYRSNEKRRSRSNEVTETEVTEVTEGTEGI